MTTMKGKALAGAPSDDAHAKVRRCCLFRKRGSEAETRRSKGRDAKAEPDHVRSTLWSARRHTRGGAHVAWSMWQGACGGVCVAGSTSGVGNGKNKKFNKKSVPKDKTPSGPDRQPIEYLPSNRCLRSCVPGHMMSVFSTSKVNKEPCWKDQISKGNIGQEPPQKVINPRSQVILGANPSVSHLNQKGPQLPLHSDFSLLATHFRRNRPPEDLLCRCMVESSSPTNFVGHSGVRIVVVGDVDIGKSSLIIDATSESISENVPSVLPHTRPPADYYPDRVPLAIIDTSSSPTSKATLVAECQSADVVVLTYCVCESFHLNRRI
ncbi:hypothetical protein KSP40_PGU006147 [Platanthera guangdongensis]|uniref:Uncharacterized protein n=1 Tax=Platanthera guangdongensis TaxID=2320717 RepID=A0ABR2MMY5_9ASPA